MTKLLQQKRKSSINVLTIFAIATFSLHLAVLLFFILQGVKMSQLSQRRPPNFVQMIDGQPIGAVDDLTRDPEAIQQFISQTMTSMFNWSGTLPPQSIAEAVTPRRDPGIQIRTPQRGSQRVATSSWVASFAISEDFRRGFLSAIAQMTPPEIFSQNTRQRITGELIIQRLYSPEQIAPGRWRVGMVADLIQTREDDDRRTITPFNKDVLVRAVDYFPYPLANTTTDIQQAISSNRAARLEIYEIRDLCLLEEYINLSPDSSNPCKNPPRSESFIR